MRILRTALLAGIAALSIGFSGAASAQTSNVMTVRLPSGGLAEIRYVGDVPPQVVFLPRPAAMPTAFDGFTPISSLFGSESPFAMLERISAEMDRRAEAMFRYAATVADQAGTANPGYTHVAAAPGSGFCMRGVRVAQIGGAQPRVESYSSGDCGPAAATGGSVRMPVGPAVPARQPELLYTQGPGAAPPARAKQPDLILTQNTGAQPYAGMVRQVAQAR